MTGLSRRVITGFLHPGEKWQADFVIFFFFLSVPSNWMLFISSKEALAKGHLSTSRFSIFKTCGDEAHPFPQPLMIERWKEKAGSFQMSKKESPRHIATK